MFDNITEMVSVIIFLNISCYTGYKEQWLLEKRAKENPVLMDGPVLTEHHSEESLRAQPCCADHRNSARPTPSQALRSPGHV